MRIKLSVHDEEWAFLVPFRISDAEWASFPSVVVELCDFHDVDGPLLLKNDRADGMKYERGVVQPPSAKLWG